MSIDFNRINGPQRKILRKALTDVFRRREFEMFLEDHDYGPLENLVGEGTFTYQVFQLIGKFRRQGNLDDLMADVNRSYPDAPALEDLQIRFGFADAEAESQRVLGGKGLERAVRDAGFDDVVLWADQLLSAGRRICRISYPLGVGGLVRGTGFLVGSDLVLTNYHVMEEVLKGRAEADRVRLNFGYAETAEGPSAVDKYWLDQDWDVAHAPYGAADLATDAGLPEDGELDFALLRLEKAAGDAQGPNGKRGWFDLAQAASPARENAIVFVLQHPDGKPLKQSIGVVQRSETPLRLRYDADTEEGSSGGLVLDQKLTPLALHHAGDPASKIKARYNQGIPLPLIQAALQGNGGPPRVLRSSGATSRAVERSTEPASDRQRASTNPALPRSTERSIHSSRGELAIPKAERERPSRPPEERPAGPPLLFYSYAREDGDLREQLAKQLKMLERQKLIQSWYDGEIDFDQDRDTSIQQKLRAADIILLLASRDYLSSDEIWDRDLKIALERHADKQDKVRVIPIHLRPVELDETPFSHLQPLPFDKRAVTDRSGPNRDRAFAEIARAIRAIAVKISARR